MPKVRFCFLRRIEAFPRQDPTQSRAISGCLNREGVKGNMQMAAERTPVEGFTATLEKGREQVALGGDSILLGGAVFKSCHRRWRLNILGFWSRTCLSLCDCSFRRFILPRQLSCVHLAFPNSPFHRVPSPVLILSQKSSDRFTVRQNSVIVTHSGLTDSRDSVK